MEVLEVLKGVFNETVGGAYVAGTLDSSGYVLNPESWAPVKGYFDKEREDIPYTAEERYWWCKNYVKSKTHNHAYYLESVDYITKYEEN